MTFANARQKLEAMYDGYWTMRYDRTTAHDKSVTIKCSCYSERHGWTSSTSWEGLFRELDIKIGNIEADTQEPKEE